MRGKLIIPVADVMLSPTWSVVCPLYRALGSLAVYCQDPPVCQHCKQYGFECTFFLPITETRFKKKKLEEEGADKEKSEPARAASSQADSHPRHDIGVLGELGSF